MFTKEILDNVLVSIKGKWIAAVGNDLKHCIGEKTEVIDAKGKTIIPGLIDGHGHYMSLGESKIILDLNNVRDWDGKSLGTDLIRELKRECGRLELVDEQVKQLEGQRTSMPSS